ncbi:MAG: type II toxin-antitoxin system RelE/ParE family toxin, partial [Marinilabiliaceae bacterium]|nr:type II toxin-antitoxin system RelE/ParE family toxin [Marinilabiliaceae bacterium]
NEVEKLAEYPLSGRDCSHIRENYRYSKVKSHYIFYKYQKNENMIEIIRVLHQNMDIENRLKE